LGGRSWCGKNDYAHLTSKAISVSACTEFSYACFEGEELVRSPRRLADHSSAFAMTVHKIGFEFAEVLLVPNNPAQCSRICYTPALQPKHSRWKSGLAARLGEKPCASGWLVRAGTGIGRWIPEQGKNMGLFN
jgi:hypothetical protein